MIGRWKRPAITMTAVAAILGACGGTADPPSPTPGLASSASQPSPTDQPTATPRPTAVPVGSVVLTETDCVVDVDAAAIEPGQISMEVVNRTSGRAGVHLWRIAPDHTFEELAVIIAQARRDAEARRSPTDHPAFLAGLIPIELESGASGTLVGGVREGVHGFVCARQFPGVGMAPYAAVGPLAVAPH